MKPSRFSLARPTQVQECLQELAAGEGVKVLAGGQSLVPLLNLRLAHLDRLVDINRVEALQEIQASADGVTLGSLVRHRRLETDVSLAERLPIVSRVATHIGFLAIRNRGSLGGSLAHADPAGELPALMALLGARVGVCSAGGGRRDISVPDLVLGPLMTSLGEDELIVDVTVPWPVSGERHGFWELAARAGDFARLGALVKFGGGNEGAAAPWLRLVLFGSELQRLRVEDRTPAVLNASAIHETVRDMCQSLIDQEEPMGERRVVERWAMAAARRAVDDALARPGGDGDG